MAYPKLFIQVCLFLWFHWVWCFIFALINIFETSWKATVLFDAELFMKVLDVRMGWSTLIRWKMFRWLRLDGRVVVHTELCLYLLWDRNGYKDYNLDTNTYVSLAINPRNDCLHYLLHINTAHFSSHPKRNPKNKPPPICLSLSQKDNLDW